jgi:hypothetical protein
MNADLPGYFLMAYTAGGRKHTMNGEMGFNQSAPLSKPNTDPRKSAFIRGSSFLWVLPPSPSDSTELAERPSGATGFAAIPFF